MTDPARDVLDELRGLPPTMRALIDTATLVESEPVQLFLTFDDPDWLLEAAHPLVGEDGHLAEFRIELGGRRLRLTRVRRRAATVILFFSPDDDA